MNNDSVERLRDHVAPCSLLCYTCPGYREGAVAACARTMCRYFEGYCEFNEASLPAEHRGLLPEMESFRKKLRQYAVGRCDGCRKKHSGDAGSPKGCVVTSCVREHRVDYCGECPEFPCGKTEGVFKEKQLRAWLEGNRRIKEIGVGKYFEEKKDVSHYIDYAPAAGRMDT